MPIVSVPLTQGKVAIIDEEDLPLVAPYKWHAISHRTGIWYAETQVPTGLERPRQRDIKLHRLLLEAPSGFQVDHKDGDGLNNRRSNLRLATSAENSFNRRRYSDSRTGFKGVIWRPALGRYVAKIGYQRKQYHLGVFQTAEEAALAYDAKAREWFGAFARLNFPDLEGVQTSRDAAFDQMPT